MLLFDFVVTNEGDFLSMKGMHKLGGCKTSRKRHETNTSARMDDKPLNEARFYTFLLYQLRSANCVFFLSTQDNEAPEQFEPP